MVLLEGEAYELTPHNFDEGIVVLWGLRVEVMSSLAEDFKINETPTCSAFKSQRCS